MMNGVVVLDELLDGLEILQDFMNRHGFESTAVRLGIVDGKFSLLSGNDAVNIPSVAGYWSEAETLTADTVVRELALKMEKQVSRWLESTGVFAISTERLRMAN